MEKIPNAWLTDIRNKLGLSLTEAAAKSNVSLSYLCEIEKGDKTPSVEMAKSIGNALGFPWLYFFEPNLRDTRTKHKKNETA